MRVLRLVAPVQQVRTGQNADVFTRAVHQTDRMHLEMPDGTRLFVQKIGRGTPLLMLSGGPGCVNYLPPVAELMQHRACYLPDPRGVGRSEGGPHDIRTALADLECLRQHLGLDTWDVLGHSWGADLGLAYALAHPQRVGRLISFAGTGIQYDRDWKAAYEAGKHLEAEFVVEYSQEVHAALRADYRKFIKEPDLLARLSRLPVPVTFLHMGADIRPSWPAQQLAALIPGAQYIEVPGAPHHAWLTHARELSQVLNTISPVQAS